VSPDHERYLEDLLAALSRAQVLMEDGLLVWRGKAGEEGVRGLLAQLEGVRDAVEDLLVRYRDRSATGEGEGAALR
jgi:hypothetical protein